MSGPLHFIAHFTVTDPDVYRVYEKGFFPILKKHGGKFITFDDSPIVLEGSLAEGRVVIIEWESEAQLMGWWNDPEYVALATHRHGGTTTHSVSVIHPVPERA